jgi:hypothetical protein
MIICETIVHLLVIVQNNWPFCLQSILSSSCVLVLDCLCVCLCVYVCRPQWPRGLRRGSAAARLLRFWVRIPPWAWMSVYCECCVLSGRSLCDGLITRPEESYRLWRVVVCEQETSKMRRLKPATGLWKIQPQWVVTPGKQRNNNKRVCVCVCVCVCVFV